MLGMDTTTREQILIVGGGIAGASLATVLARDGLEVVVLERDREYREVNKGESMMPWGWAEVERLGLADELGAAGGMPNPTWTITLPDGEPFELPLTALRPDTPGSHSLGHVTARARLADAAARAGADVRFGIRDVTVTPGAAPTVEWTQGGRRHTCRPRLVIAADGRASRVRRQLGLRLDRTDRTHVVASQLVEGTRDLGDAVVAATGDERLVLMTPLTDDRARVYLVTRDQRYSGTKDSRRMLDATRLSSLADPGRWADATPTGGCVTYGGEDTWLNRPVVDGVVLVGDAAGHTTPIIGQGLSVTMRDVRIVAEHLLSTNDWSPRALDDYARQRAEYLRRVRIVGQMWARLRLLPDEPQLRAGEHPVVQQLTPGIFAGLDSAPAELFTDDLADTVLAAAHAAA